MKKAAQMIIMMILAVLLCTSVYAVPEGEFPTGYDEGRVQMILAGRRMQVYPIEKDSLDTVWIFFDSGEFRQFVIMEREVRMFSYGRFALEDGEVLIERTGKYMEGAGFGEYRSVHAYVMDVEEYALVAAAGNAWDENVQGAADDAGRDVAAVYWGVDASEGAADVLRIEYKDGNVVCYRDIDGYREASDGSGAAGVGMEADGPGKVGDEYVLLYEAD